MQRQRQDTHARTPGQSVNLELELVNKLLRELDAYAERLDGEGYDDEQRAERLSGQEAAAGMFNARESYEHAARLRELVGQLRDARRHPLADELELELERKTDPDVQVDGRSVMMPAPNRRAGTRPNTIYVGADVVLQLRQWFPSTADGAVDMTRRCFAWTLDMFVDGVHVSRRMTNDRNGAWRLTFEALQTAYDQGEAVAFYANAQGCPSSSRPGPSKVRP